MIPVGVGRGLLGSYARIVEQEIQDPKKRRMLSNHQIGKERMIARFLLGIKFLSTTDRPICITRSLFLIHYGSDFAPGNWH